MNASLRKPMTLHEFLAWERRQDLRYEFDGLAPIAMTGGTFERAGDDWIGHVLESPAVLLMPEIGIELPLPRFMNACSSPRRLKTTDTGPP